MSDSSSTKKWVKYLLSFVPTPFLARRYPHLNRFEKWKLSVLCDMLLEQTGGMVFSGPFSTMKVVEGSTLGSDPRMILGSYEAEIHSVINDVIVEAPAQIIDIGAAHGYYAVGFALKIANTRVTAFEAVEDEHWNELAALAELNGVADRIEQHGACTPAALTAVCKEGAFILSDCEGQELDLCDPTNIPVLKSCMILIELHEFHRPRLVATLVNRFRQSHSITMIEETRRDPACYRILKHLPATWRSIAVEEGKWIDKQARRVTTCLRFMLLTPKRQRMELAGSPN